jgi:hypothetical protein
MPGMGIPKQSPGPHGTGCGSDYSLRHNAWWKKCTGKGEKTDQKGYAFFHVNWFERLK